MSSSYDIYFRRNTWVYGLDPRVKLAIVFVLIVLTFLWPLVPAALGVSGIALRTAQRVLARACIGSSLGLPHR